MKWVMRLMDRVIDAAGALAGISVFLICFAVTWGVIARYFHIGAHWVEPVTVYMFIAASFLAASYAMKKNEHIRVDILLGKLNPGMKRMLETLLMSVSLALFLYISKLAFDMFQQSLTFNTKDLSLLQVPIWIPQAFVFIGFVLLVLSIVRRILVIWMPDPEVQSGGGEWNTQ